MSSFMFLMITHRSFLIKKIFLKGKLERIIYKRNCTVWDIRTHIYDLNKLPTLYIHWKGKDFLISEYFERFKQKNKLEKEMYIRWLPDEMAQEEDWELFLPVNLPGRFF